MLSYFTKKARELGFIAIGFSRPGEPLYFNEFMAWLRKRKHADMAWIERHTDLRKDPAGLLRGCGTIISLAFPYESKKPGTPDGFTVSRYSRPALEDYHDELRFLCRDLAGVIEKKYPGSKTRICVDSAPILERSLACLGGIGFIGKNNMLIIPDYGSFFFLAEILTTAPIDFPGSEPMENGCGSCTLCVDACPTGALEKPFSLDASKCLSYLTIETKGEVQRELGEKMGDCFFGCDQCQEACPFNEGKSSAEISLPPTDEILLMEDADFKERFGRTAIARAGLEKLKSNIRAIKG